MLLPVLSNMQGSLAQARDEVLVHSGLPGAGSDMGTPGSIYDAATQRADGHLHPNSGWSVDFEDRHTRVLYTREALGLNSHYSTKCKVDHHQQVEVTGYLSGRWRDPAALLIPHGPPQSLQDAVNGLFMTGSAPDISFPRPAPCPSCDNYDSASLWSILPWGADNAPSRLFLASSRVDNDDHSGEPPVPSPELTLGIECSLVAVIYSIPNHFVTQFRCRGKWFKYDCMQPSGITTSSTEFDSDWYLGLQHMFVYLRASMVSLIPQPKLMCTVVVATVGLQFGQRRHCKDQTCHRLTVAAATAVTPKELIPCYTVPRRLLTKVEAAPRFDEI